MGSGFEGSVPASTGLLYVLLLWLTHTHSSNVWIVYGGAVHCGLLLYVFIAALVEFTESDEALADLALLGDVFLFMKDGMLGCEGFSQEEFYIRRLHTLITDFLALMPIKASHSVLITHLLIRF